MVTRVLLGGRTESDKSISIQGYGYRDREWHAAYAGLVRAELWQCVGRARPILDKGIPVLILSNENLGYGVASDTSDLASVTPRVAEAAAVVAQLCSTGAPVTTDEVRL